MKQETRPFGLDVHLGKPHNLKSIIQSLVHDTCGFVLKFYILEPLVEQS